MYQQQLLYSSPLTHVPGPVLALVPALAHFYASTCACGPVPTTCTVRISLCPTKDSEYSEASWWRKETFYRIPNGAAQNYYTSMRIFLAKKKTFLLLTLFQFDARISI